VRSQRKVSRMRRKLRYIGLSECNNWRIVGWVSMKFDTGEILGSHGDEYKDGCLLGCCAV
jgi:hypothetical protein